MTWLIESNIIEEGKIILLDVVHAMCETRHMTTTTLSSKGQIVLPRLVRNKLHLTPGVRFKCDILGDSVILTPEHPRRLVREYVTDSLTGLRVTKASCESEPVTTEMVKELLEDYL